MQEKNKHVICRLRVGAYGENCDLGRENAALGLRRRAAFSSPRSQVFTIRTSQPANNIYILRISHQESKATKPLTRLTIPKRIMHIKFFSEEAILWYKKLVVTTISTRSYFRQTNACSIDSRKHMSKNQQRQREKSLTYCMETVENYTGVFVSSWRSIDSIASLSSILSGLMEIKSLSTVWTKFLTFSYNTIEGRTFSFKVSVYPKWQPRVVAASWSHVS